jgi:hypothetical protein
MTPRFLEFIYTRQGYQPNVARSAPHDLTSTTNGALMTRPSLSNCAHSL